MKARKCLAAVLLITCASFVHAAEPDEPPPVLRKQRFSIGIGLVQPLSKIDFRPLGGGEASNGDLGSRIGAEYLYFLTPRIGAGFSVDYIDFTGTRSESLYPAAASSVSGDTWLMLGILRCTLRDHGAARPFVLIGGGGARNTTVVDVRPGNWPDTNTHETRRLVDDTVWTPAAAARIGVDLDVEAFQPGILTLETGWTGLASRHYGPTARGAALGLSGVDGPRNVLSFTLRYGWRF